MQSLHTKQEVFGSKNSAFQTSIESLERHYGFSFQANVTSAAALNATATVQASNDGVNFIDTATTMEFTTNGSKIVNVDAAHYRYARLSFTFSAGSGKFETYFCSKGA